jgi:hypothetical protein
VEVKIASIHNKLAFAEGRINYPFCVCHQTNLSLDLVWMILIIFLLTNLRYLARFVRRTYTPATIRRGWLAGGVVC